MHQSLPINTNHHADKDGWELKNTEIFSQSKDSMFGDMKAAPTAIAITARATLFRQPWPLDSLPATILQYLSALRKSDWRAASAVPPIPFSFYKEKGQKKKKKDQKFKPKIISNSI